MKTARKIIPLSMARPTLSTSRTSLTFLLALLTLVSIECRSLPMQTGEAKKTGETKKTEETKKGGETETMQECIQQWHLQRHNSPWRLVSTESEGDYAETIPLLQDLTGMQPVPGLQAYTAAPSVPFLALDEKRDRLVANGNVFKKLRRVDATSLTEPRTVAILTDQGLKTIPLKTMVSFLLESEMIQTYVHMESRLCLFEQADANDLYRADLKGSHIYFTNERNEAPLSFSILINKASREIQFHPRDN